MGCASRAQGERASEAVDGVSVEMDLWYRDIEKIRFSCSNFLCALDESDDRHADLALQYGIKLSAISAVGSIVGANEGLKIAKSR